ncbi:MAG: ABC-type transport auxiliary lipoprotein family protein [Phycisphaerales bacterium]
MIRTRRTVKTPSGSPGISLRLGLPCLCLLGIGLVAGGCSSVSPQQEDRYLLEVVRPGEPLPTIVNGSLEVQRFSVNAAFTARNFVYRLDQFKYETDYYRQFLIAPSAMITEQTRNWLARSGLFTEVLPTGSRVVPDYTLEGNVTSLYGDFSNESSPAAVIEVRLFLLNNVRGNENVVFTQIYRAAVPMQDRTAQAFVAALNQGFADILGRLEADLQKALKNSAEGVAPVPVP